MTTGGSPAPLRLVEQSSRSNFNPYIPGPPYTDRKINGKLRSYLVSDSRHGEVYCVKLHLAEEFLAVSHASKATTVRRLQERCATGILPPLWLSCNLTRFQIISSSSDTDYLDQLIPALKDAQNSNRTAGFMQSLSHYADEKEADIEQIGLTQHEEFLQSVNQLQQVREGTVALTAEILQLNQSIQASTEKLAAQKEKLVETKSIRQNIAEASEGLKESLKILHAVNQAHELIRKRNYYAALKALDDLQNEHLIPTIQNKYATQHKLADMIQKSIPASQKAISDAVMNDLNTWLYRIRETSQFLGEVAFYHTSLRQKRQKDRSEANPHLKTYSLNSSIELVFDESEEFDVLDNDEVAVEFGPLFEAIHIHEALGQSDKFRQEYAATRRQQKDLLLPPAISLIEDDENGLSSLLEAIAGFAIIEKATMRKSPNLRSPVDVSVLQLWMVPC